MAMLNNQRVININPIIIPWRGPRSFHAREPSSPAESGPCSLSLFASPWPFPIALPTPGTVGGVHDVADVAMFGRAPAVSPDFTWFPQVQRHIWSCLVEDSTQLYIWDICLDRYRATLIFRIFLCEFQLFHHTKINKKNHHPPGVGIPLPLRGHRAQCVTSEALEVSVLSRG